MRSPSTTRATDRGGLAKAVDGLLELSVAGSFSQVGYVLRHCLEDWRDPGRLEGKAMIVTGASSGVGQAAAIELAALGAEVWLVGRNAERLSAASDAARNARGSGRVHTAQVDVVNAEAVSSFVDQVSSMHTHIDALVHNAGALFSDYEVADDGTGILTERTLATHVLAPFRLSWLLAPLMFRAEQPVITTVTSGGMYTQRFDPDQMESVPGGVSRSSCVRAGQTGTGCPLARMGAALGMPRSGQLRRPSWLGSDTWPGRGSTHLREVGTSPSHAGPRSRHGGVAGR